MTGLILAVKVKILKNKPISFNLLLKNVVIGEVFSAKVLIEISKQF